ncbi:MAG: Nif3-like dinuclear metal center hexameric protein [Ruminococcaceae bacterium]|nr:Nif3-like dinuclear metal center hexameric protein [Oscillospiraceae bacterium]
MPSVTAIAGAINALAPFDTAEEWDNSGLLIDSGAEVRKALLALDITAGVVVEAVAAGCQLIVAHHPVIWDPLKRLSRGDVVYQMVQKGLSAICAHTNLDAAAGGVNDVLAGLLGLQDPQPFAAFGRIATLPAPLPVADLARLCTQKLGAHVKLADAGRPVQTVAVVGGSGGSLLEDAIAAGADCIVTGEASHHHALDAMHAGVSLVVAGHFATEFPVMPVLAEQLAAQFPDVTFTVSRVGCDPFTYMSP